MEQPSHHTETDVSLAQSRGPPLRTSPQPWSPLALLIGVQLQAKNVAVSAEALHHFSHVAEVYLTQVSGVIKKLTEQQRRSRPSKSDVLGALRVLGLSPTALYREYYHDTTTRPRITANLTKVQREAQSRTWTQEGPEDLDLNDYSITDLVPRTTPRPNYIPHHFPEFPPDYTYRNTPDYMASLTDMEQLRLKLVEESRMTEKSLYRLIDGDKTGSGSPETLDLDSIMSGVPEIGSPDINLDTTKLDIPQHQESELPPVMLDEEQELQRQEQLRKQEIAFDFEAYAAKRANLVQKRQSHIEKIRKLRQNNIFMEAEKHFSPYSTNPMTENNQNRFKTVVNDAYEDVIKAVRRAEAENQAQIDKILKERETQQAQNKQDTIEFGFNFDIGSGSDSEEGEGIDFEERIDFGDEREGEGEGEGDGEGEGEGEVEKIDFGDGGENGDNGEGDDDDDDDMFDDNMFDTPSGPMSVDYVDTGGQGQGPGPGP